MWELVTVFFSSFVIALSGALMPGPLLTATIGESAQRGVKAGPLLVLGHGILELVLLLALLFGLAPLLQRQDVFVVIATVGGAILLWMALGMFRTLPGLSLSSNAEATGGNPLIVSGVLLSIANPYWILWWATIGFGYILYCLQFGVWGISLFFIGHILADLVWYSAVSMAVGKGRHFLSDRLYRGVIGTCAAFLVVFACYFFYAGFQKAIA
ncbi:MAG: lysine transporter LysE [Deltaproteobacteria bacterium]|nr:lysine transporter LysE [Deltaproteobacteria bacterium]